MSVHANPPELGSQGSAELVKLGLMRVSY
jgi:hypothetical protein